MPIPFAKWKFYLAEDGWRWICFSINGTVLCLSNKAFISEEHCLEDAQSNGYKG